MAGAIYILQSERAHRVDVPLDKAMLCVTKWSACAAELRAAIKLRDMKKEEPTR